ncbi:nucleoside-diphosphate sugar epimerase/dehydratase [Neptuniibacter sp. 2_MG-2023]|uniref:polysaccharide biosynthesis protein n=1 Tax=Neptuniibacter sp. 2_MG-2023 TaxID=3062671 RepID=UPI0026E315AA|nr:nucleoside-diphosphate sugar epimerase/dehydratase [Neptuniibacter sp. 2_MG-2023]MDO6515531.1 nucleoside-diphosphate sugar epimerase/dehydratase [Neptuniibacter sp. 2_MG-2023]
MLKFISQLSRNKKRLVFVVSDVCFLTVCCWLSFALRYGEWNANGFIHWPAYVLAPVISIPVFIQLGLYRAVIRYIGNKALWTVVKAVTLSVLIWATFVHLLGLPQAVPRSVIFIYWFVAVVTVGGSRMLARWLILHKFPGGEQKVKCGSDRVIIYGAGSSGRQLSEALYHSKEFSVVAYVDDSTAVQGLELNSIRIHPPSSVGLLIDQFDVNSILLAIPSASNQRKKEIIDELSFYKVKVLTLPGLSDLAGGKVSINDVREVDIADLLGRDEVAPNKELLGSCIRDLSVMVTGAGGSIGSELCRQILKQQPNVLVLFELSEFSLYSIEKELLALGAGQTVIIPVLGSVTDKAHLEKILQSYRVDTVYHAAAYKHVPIVESNNIAGLQNNILGTWRCAEAAISAGVRNFVLISTDKAVRPTNVMGASKRFAELVLQGLSKREENCSDIRFAIVRFGNVLGSSGSVIPLFKEQIGQGGPVTVTDPEITRYFMTIPEAASLVIQAGSMGASGDVFVLDMGEPVKIFDLAKQMINLTGLSVRNAQNPSGDIEIDFTGLRNGEKLYEELLIGDDVLETTHPMIMRAQEVMLPWDQLELVLDSLQVALESFDYDAIREILLQNVNGYNPQHEIRDLLYDFKLGK